MGPNYRSKVSHISLGTMLPLPFPRSCPNANSPLFLQIHFLSFGINLIQNG